MEETPTVSVETINTDTLPLTESNLTHVDEALAVIETPDISVVDESPTPTLEPVSEEQIALLNDTVSTATPDAVSVEIDSNKSVRGSSVDPADANVDVEVKSESLSVKSESIDQNPEVTTNNEEDEATALTPDPVSTKCASDAGDKTDKAEEPACGKCFTTLLFLPLDP